jgi:copper chaperone CopZ
MRQSIILFFSLAILCTVACTGEKAATTAAEGETPEVAADEATPTATAVGDKAAEGNCMITMKVDGMACGAACPPQVTKALLSVPGVESVDVSFEKSQAEVKASGAACAEGAQGTLLEALKSKSYEGEVKSVAAVKNPS